MLGFYNAVPSLLWSALGLVPLTIFCYQHVARPWLYGFIIVSLLAYGLPFSRFRRLQLGASVGLYQKLGVPRLNHFTQHGTLINWLIRRQYPQYRRVRTRASLAGFARATYYQEQFHLVMFVFFLLVSVYAVVRGNLGWAMLLTFLNVLYNVYPMWLQQYLRLRLAGAPKPDK
ncbi:hypothetical protein GCM10011383_10780 [Hymenobacter cavernae]|uniref:Glycosyl-4,4'-diaponeurosporenoate acyltransferase n=1 Tax=Hymenobacter cavernae TaxID=2044852 RepID=A0ABQ1TR88_9BACT|nr:hypothetical protein GCM10011383_10780 [Hymenobacter cavernae]